MMMPGDPWRARRVVPWALLLPLVVLVLWSCERVEDPQKTNPFEPGIFPGFNLVAELSAHHDTVSLSWDAVAGRGVRGYRLFRYETSAEKVIEDALADVPDTVLTYDDDTIIGGTTYLYKVAALDAAGRASDVEGQEGVEVEVPARGRIEITTTPDDAPWSILGPQLDDEGSGDTVYEDQLPGSYTITWRELEGWVRPDPAVQTGTLALGDTLRFSGIFTVELPAAPSGLVATAVSASQINLSWTDNSDNETGFKIERSSVSGTEGFTHITTQEANVTLYSDTNLVASTQYWYRMCATNQAGDSEWSNVASESTLPTQNVLVVYPDGSGPYENIQAAIDSSNDGDVIQLANGIFSGLGNRDLLVEGKSLTIRSESGNPESCQILGSQQHPGERVIRFISNEGHSIYIEDISIRGGYIWGSGGGVRIENSSPEFKNVRFVDNRATSNGGALYVSGDSQPKIDNCLFENNLAGFMARTYQHERSDNSGGGAIFVDPSNPLARVIVHNSVFLNNHTIVDSGGAVYGRGHFRYCTFLDNVAGEGKGGAAYLRDSVVSYCTFFGNLSMGNGGALHVLNTTISNSTIVKNSCYSYAPAVFCEIDVTIQWTIIAHNDPPGILGHWQPTLYCCNYYGNYDEDGGYVSGQIGQNGNFCVFRPKIYQLAAGRSETSGDFSLSTG